MPGGAVRAPDVRAALTGTLWMSGFGNAFFEAGLLNYVYFPRGSVVELCYLTWLFHFYVNLLTG